MNGLLSCTPSPLAIRLMVAATTLLLVQMIFCLRAEAVTGALRAMTWVVASVSVAALALALLGRWPARTRVWSGRDAG